MSTFGDIEDWVVNRLDTQVAVLTSVVPIIEPMELKIVARNPPSAAVLLVGSDPVDQVQSGDQYITVNIGIWVSAHAFRGGEDLDNTNGLHDLFDSVHTAFKGQVPTAPFDPLRFAGHRTNDIADGLAVMVMEYITGVII